MTVNLYTILYRLLISSVIYFKKISFVDHIIRFILNKPLYKGVIILGSGTAVVQLIGILSMPIITRLYTPSDLGILAVFSSVLAMLGIGASLKYEFALGLPKNDGEAINLLFLCVILLFSTTVSLSFLLLFASFFYTNPFHIDLSKKYYGYLVIGFFGMGLYNVLNNWAIRQQDYKMITHTKINQGIGGVSLKIILGIISFGPLGLIIGHIISQITGILILGRRVWSKEINNLNKLSFCNVKILAKKYKAFPIFHFPASIINTLSLQIPSIILLWVYDSQIVGFYSLAYTLVVFPGNAISQAMGQAYLGEATKMVRENSKSLREFYLKTIKHLSIIAIPLIGLPALLAPFLIPYIFGEVWSDSGLFCWLLAPMAIVGFIISPTSILSIYGNNHWNLIWDITRTGGVILGFYFCILFRCSVSITLTVYTIIMIVMYFVLVFIVLHVIEKFLKFVVINQ
ncbi:oligosaccharide flippase family protein [Methanospirillum purgamenti]|uniref:Oligosaccharide flippase family protein n=1 Tax=Methanospirillum hungatei TaxID=2203 RepID=A0A8F5ZDC4_METHU|nr:oligosaccharide flippase family protein [Methanospirillum hungatei]QXO93567.1 oligosaccharide flippase family protein [Methanospirillum hungatei]